MWAAAAAAAAAERQFVPWYSVAHGDRSLHTVWQACTPVVHHIAEFPIENVEQIFIYGVDLQVSHSLLENSATFAEQGADGR